MIHDRNYHLNKTRSDLARARKYTHIFLFDQNVIYTLGRQIRSIIWCKHLVRFDSKQFEHRANSFDKMFSIDIYFLLVVLFILICTPGTREHLFWKRVLYSLLCLILISKVASEHVTSKLHAILDFNQFYKTTKVRMFDEFFSESSLYKQISATHSRILPFSVQNFSFPTVECITIPKPIIL